MCLIRANKEKAEDDLICYKIMVTLRDDVDENGSKKADDDYSGCDFYTPFQRKRVPLSVVEGKEPFRPDDSPTCVDVRRGGLVINGGFIHSYAKFNDAMRDARDVATNALCYGEPRVYACVFECRIDKGDDYMLGDVALRPADFYKDPEELATGYASLKLTFVKMVKAVHITALREALK